MKGHARRGTEHIRSRGLAAAACLEDPFNPLRWSVSGERVSSDGMTRRPRGAHKDGQKQNVKGWNKKKEQHNLSIKMEKHRNKIMARSTMRGSFGDLALNTISSMGVRRELCLSRHGLLGSMTEPTLVRLCACGGHGPMSGVGEAVDSESAMERMTCCAFLRARRVDELPSCTRGFSRHTLVPLRSASLRVGF